MTGSISDVISASTLRRDNRSPRPTMVTRSRNGADGRADGTGARRSAVASDTSGLLLGGFERRVPGQGEKDVIERGGVDGERAHRGSTGIKLVEQRTDVRRAAVGRYPQ